MKVSLPLISAAGKNRALVWGALVFFAVYLALGACPLTKPSYLPLTAYDQAIPLLPWTLVIYLSDYFFILLALLQLKDPKAFSTSYFRMIAGIIVSFLVFLIFPTVYPRPAEPETAWVWAQIFSYLHWIDLPTNCFPSLHVSITLLAAVAWKPERASLRWGGYAWAIAICLSTLTTKQHYILDVLGGMFVTLACVWMIPFRPIKKT